MFYNRDIDVKEGITIYIRMGLKTGLLNFFEGEIKEFHKRKNVVYFTEMEISSNI